MHESNTGQVNFHQKSFVVLIFSLHGITNYSLHT
jgi:hypothetical protein